MVLMLKIFVTSSKFSRIRHCGFKQKFQIQFSACFWDDT